MSDHIRPDDDVTIEINPGDTVHCETDEVSTGQVTPGCSAEIFGKLNFDLLYPLAGPIFVKGAQPGDILEVEILRLEPIRWGWAGLIPGLGLLADYLSASVVTCCDLGAEPRCCFDVTDQEKTQRLMR